MEGGDEADGGAAAACGSNQLVTALLQVAGGVSVDGYEGSTLIAEHVITTGVALWLLDLVGKSGYECIDVCADLIGSIDEAVVLR